MKVAIAGGHGKVARRLEQLLVERGDTAVGLITFIASPAGDFLSGCVLTLDGARDNWFGAWPPGGASDEAGEPLAEERKPRE